MSGGGKKRVVWQLPQFSKDAKKFGIDGQQVAEYVRKNPEGGEPLGKRLWKIRFGRANEGKRGGFRVYYYYNSGLESPVMLIAISDKRRVGNLSPKEKKRLQVLCARLDREFEDRRGG